MQANLTDVVVSNDNGTTSIRRQWKPAQNYALEENSANEFYKAIESGHKLGDLIDDIATQSDKKLAFVSKRVNLGLDGALNGESEWRAVTIEEAYFGTPWYDFYMWQTTISQESVYLGLAYSKQVLPYAELGAFRAAVSQDQVPSKWVTATNGQAFDDMPANVLLLNTLRLAFNAEATSGGNSRVSALMKLNGTINAQQIQVNDFVIAPGHGLISVQARKELYRHNITGETGFYWQVEIEIKVNPFGWFTFIPNTGTYYWDTSTSSSGKKVYIRGNPHTNSIVRRDNRGYLNEDGSGFVANIDDSFILYLQMYRGDDWAALSGMLNDSSEFPAPEGWPK